MMNALFLCQFYLQVTEKCIVNVNPLWLCFLDEHSFDQFWKLKYIASLTVNWLINH